MKYIGVSTPAWTIVGDKDRGRWKDLPPSDEPAPGHSQDVERHKFVYPVAPKWKFGTNKERQKQFSKKDEVPGPGTYDKHEEEIKEEDAKKKKNRTFGKSVSKKKFNKFPGPGAHNPRKVARSAPKFSLGYKSTKELHFNDVGPGKYEPNFTCREFNRFSSFSKSKRKGTDEMRVTCAPGPGSYFTQSQNQFRLGKKKGKKLERGQFCTFGSKSHSRFKSLKSETPGVGSYTIDAHTIKTWIKAKGAKSRKLAKQRENNLKDQFDNEVPGPGAYSIKTNLTKSTAPSFGFGTMKRPKLNNVDPKIPGPADYIGNVLDPEEIEDMKRDTNNFFGTSKRDFMKIPKDFSKGNKAATSHGKLGGADNAEEDNDGKNKWLKNPLFAGPKFSFKGKRGNKFDKDKLRFPGPGAYYTAHNFMLGLSNPHHIIGTGDRFNEIKPKSMTPGPGDYDISMGLSQNGMKFPKSIRKDPANVDPEIEVGPNTYDIKSTVPQLQPWEERAQKEAGFKITLD